MKRYFIFILISGILFSHANAFAEIGRVSIRTTGEDPKPIGKVRLEDTADGLKIVANVKNVTPGRHGFHIHQFGDCSDDGKGAGDHYNPEGAPHGLLVKDGPQHAHAGDLGNIRVNQDGSGHFQTLVPNLALSGGKYNVAGRSFILHEKADDFGQPAGNAGKRVGCGKILITKE